MSITKVREKFQVMLPKNVRDRIHVKVGDLLELKAEEGRIIATPVPDPSKKLAQLLGDFKFTRRDRERASQKFTTRS
ncbi:MAG: AbrB/MazE/SpoVT family DNA-binding domain-containing protein [Thaumarchaeota archaeon]|nr:AbrB/MazE/SpoVT family DNA-binding domain-containing protein [Nitrososphaerota archaeon]